MASPEILHEQTGLQIRRNAKNKFLVVHLHYTADPMKRSPEWKAEASAGMPPAKWEKEYEISWEALYGAKVFPEIITNRENIVLKPPHLDIGRTQVCWGGFDYGQRNPTSFHVYTIIDGVTYAIWELYQPCRNIPEFADKMKDCPYWEQLRYIAADPDIFRTRTSNKFGMACSVADLFVEQRVTKFIAGNNDEATWLATLRQHWAKVEDPTFRIFDCCPNMIREFESAIFATMTDRLLATQNYREGIADHNNHALDDNKYFFNSKARIVSRTIKLPNMVKQFSMRY